MNRRESIKLMGMTGISLAFPTLVKAKLPILKLAFDDEYHYKITNVKEIIDTSKFVKGIYDDNMKKMYVNNQDYYVAEVFINKNDNVIADFHNSNEGFKDLANCKFLYEHYGRKNYHIWGITKIAIYKFESKIIYEDANVAFNLKEVVNVGTFCELFEEPSLFINNSTNMQVLHNDTYYAISAFEVYN